ncbi:MAG: sugar ABC transporter substrate-binding protein, partial [Candidatus Ornithomonoglobus sp.]
MKNTKTVRLLAFIGVLAVAAGAMTACGTKTSDTTEDGKILVSVGDYPEKEGEDKDNWDARIAEFEAANDDVKIDPDTWAFDLKTFYSKAAGGQL